MWINVLKLDYVFICNMCGSVFVDYVLYVCISDLNLEFDFICNLSAFVTKKEEGERWKKMEEPLGPAWADSLLSAQYRPIGSVGPALAYRFL